MISAGNAGANFAHVLGMSGLASAIELIGVKKPKTKTKV